MRTSRIVTPVIAVLAALALACGAGSESGSSTSGGSADSGAKPAEPKGPVTVAAGQTMTLTETIFTTTTVVDITLSDVKTGVTSGNQFVKPSKGQFITAKVTVLVKEGKFSIHSSSFKLVAADGTAYDSTTMLDSKDLSGNDLTPGQKTDGTVVWDAAVGAEKGGKVALKSFLAEGDAGYWTLG